MVRLISATIVLSAVYTSQASEFAGEYHVSAPVTAPTRLDFVFPLANQSPKETPQDWLRDYKSADQRFELYLPANYDKSRLWPVVIFISPGNKAMGWRAWQRVCEQEGIIFAGPHDAGNSTDMRRRVRIVLDVLDEVRRKYNVDPDRTYITGFSGGGRIACAIGFSLPELFGGVVPICAAGQLRDETWLQHRVIDRLSVAAVTGETDFNRGEVERFRGPLLSHVGVRSKVWVVPKLGHAVPSDGTLSDVFKWLDQGVENRRKLAEKWPAIRAAQATMSRDAMAKHLLAEAKQRTSRPENVKLLYSGLMLMKGVYTRWPDLPEAAEAKQTLVKFDGDANAKWQDEDIAHQRLFLVARARSLDAYASGPLPKQYLAQRPQMAEAAVRLWKMVIDDGQNKKAVEEGKLRIPALVKFLRDTKNENE